MRTLSALVPGAVSHPGRSGKNNLFGCDDLVCAHVSHVGLVRSRNEDSLAVVESKGLAVVADGIGGQAGGELASRQAVTTIARCVEAGGDLLEAITRADRDVARAGHRLGHRDLGSTVVAVQFQKRAFWASWVGDSRAYRLADSAERLTRDHSVIGELLARGDISLARARTHPMRNVLTRALGSATLAPSDVGSIRGELGRGEYLLLCSDGLHGVLDDREIHAIVSLASNVSSAVDALLAASLDRGGPDNISLVLIGSSGSG